MRREGHDMDFHAETAKILRKGRKAALSLRSLRFFDLEISLRALREKKETGLWLSMDTHDIKKDLAACICKFLILKQALK